MNAWPLVWSHGRGAVEALGGMLGPVHFAMPGGGSAQPFAVFPWADEPLPANQQPLTGLMARGRGEWPCVPFGLNRDPDELGWDHPIHGEAAHAEWMRIDGGASDARIRLRFDADAACPIERLEREVRGVEGRAEVECELVVHVRAPCRLPIGLHPTLRLPARAGALRVDPGAFRFGRTFPREVEPGADLVAPDREFTDLAAVPRASGGTLDLRAFPLEGRTESLVQLCGVTGRVRAENHEEGYAVTVSWDTTQLPSCLLWISNAGRSAWPWSRRHFALGIEPVCAAFDLGVVASTQHNPINERGVPTALALDPAEPLVLRYRIGVDLLA